MGTWTCGDFLEMVPDEEEEGFSIEVQQNPCGLKFHIVRNEDTNQCIYPDVEPGEIGEMGCRVFGADDGGADAWWEIEADLGDVFRINFFREGDRLDDLRLYWEFLGIQCEPQVGGLSASRLLLGTIVVGRTLTPLLFHLGPRSTVRV